MLLSVFRKTAACGGLALMAGGCAVSSGTSGPDIDPEEVAAERDSAPCMELDISRDHIQESVDEDCIKAFEFVEMLKGARAAAKRGQGVSSLESLMTFYREQYPQWHETYQATVVKQLKANGFELNAEGNSILEDNLTYKTHCFSDNSDLSEKMKRKFEDATEGMDVSPRGYSATSVKCFKEAVWMQDNKGQGNKPKEPGS